MRISGLSDQTGGPAFATCAGLIHCAMQTEAQAMPAPGAIASEGNGLLGRLGVWLKENL
jgi:cell division protein FtsA